ncbi:hypothetical protein, partial [Klebsiella pneumoniae]|uniref:hypothetical protein n=1 Tax=Klebsiella pneumoniae TaxID=573 RepID=UPI003A83CA2D
MKRLMKNQDVLMIKIIFSNLGRRYKKIGNNLYLMLEKETAKLEDSLKAMIRITKENKEIDKSKKIEKIKIQAKEEVQHLEEIKNTRICELEKELVKLKLLYETKQKEKQIEREKELELTNEIKEMEQKLNEHLEINEIDENKSDTINDQKSEKSDISEAYTEILEQVNKPKKLEINTGDMNRPSTSRVKTPDNSPRNSPRISPRWTPPTYYTESYQQSD